MNDNVKIPSKLAKRLEQVVAVSGRKPEAIVREALEHQLEYEEWFMKAVQEGFESGDREGWISHEESKARLKARIDGYSRQAKAA
jgi:predicted transcriptional regulator